MTKDKIKSAFRKSRHPKFKFGDKVMLKNKKGIIIERCPNDSSSYHVKIKGSVFEHHCEVVARIKRGWKL